MLPIASEGLYGPILQRACKEAHLRPGNMHGVHGWRKVLESIAARRRRAGMRRYFRADTAFAHPEAYACLGERKVSYAIKLPSNEVLKKELQHLMKRPVGKPLRKPIIRST